MHTRYTALEENDNPIASIENSLASIEISLGTIEFSVALTVFWFAIPASNTRIRARK